MQQGPSCHSLYYCYCYCCAAAVVDGATTACATEMQVVKRYMSTHRKAGTTTTHSLCSNTISNAITGTLAQPSLSADCKVLLWITCNSNNINSSIVSPSLSTTGGSASCCSTLKLRHALALESTSASGDSISVNLLNHAHMRLHESNYSRKAA
eukprot:14558-Heterococcus_DN1.PRE.3